MTAAPEDPAVRRYLATLDRLLDGSPERALVVDGVAQHITDALADGPADAHRVRTVLDELGDPAAIAAEAGAPAARPAPRFLERRSGAVWTVLLLTVGNVVAPFVAWLVGLGFLWFSRGWTVLDKIVATVLPALLAAVLVLASGLLASNGGGFGHLALLAGLVLGAVASAVLLLVRFREPASVPPVQ